MKNMGLNLSIYESFLSLVQFFLVLFRALEKLIDQNIISEI